MHVVLSSKIDAICSWSRQCSFAMTAYSNMLTVKQRHSRIQIYLTECRCVCQPSRLVLGCLIDNTLGSSQQAKAIGLVECFDNKTITLFKVNAIKEWIGYLQNVLAWILNQTEYLNEMRYLVWIVLISLLHPKLIVRSARSATAARVKFDFC